MKVSLSVILAESLLYLAFYVVQYMHTHTHTHIWTHTHIRTHTTQEHDDDEATNRRAGPRRQSGTGLHLPTSRWNIDGDELPRADIEVR